MIKARYMEGKKAKDIGKMEGLSENQVQRSLAKARELMRRPSS
jgi:DNA-directed RNA polymerase specialized sigma24 family protein